MRIDFNRDDLFKDLVTAYRKAKVDLFYDDNPRRIDLVRYEENLQANLLELRDLLEDDDETWVHAPAFLGGVGHRGLSEKRCKQRFSFQWFSAWGIRSPKVIANAFSAGFQRMVHRV